MIRDRTRQMSRGRSGAAAVEFAFVMPVLLTLALGVWEFGRLIEAQQIVSNAAREGARLASTGTYTASTLDTAILNYLANCGLTTTGYTTRVYNLTTDPTPAANAASDDPSAATQMQHLRVQVTLPVNNVKWLIANRVMSSKTVLFGSADWYSMVDKPLSVDSSMPTS